jgi:hypothetical protein
MYFPSKFKYLKYKSPQPTFNTTRVPLQLSQFQSYKVLDWRLLSPAGYAGRVPFVAMVALYGAFCGAGDRTLLVFGQSWRHRSGAAVSYLATMPFVRRTADSMLLSIHLL